MFSKFPLTAMVTPVILEPVAAASRSLPRKVEVPQWSDDVSPIAFFTKFEQAMTCNKELKERWGRPIYLKGKAQAAFLAHVTLDMVGNYDKLKSVRLHSLGDTPEQAAIQ